MIHSITRHAAQTIWHNTMQDPACSCGILLSQAECIVAGAAYVPEQPLADIVHQQTAPLSRQWCGWFYTTLPSIKTMMAQQRAWTELNDACSLECVHVHLDSDAAGVLKMAAYRLNNGNVSSINLTMEMH